MPTDSPDRSDRPDRPDNGNARPADGADDAAVPAPRKPVRRTQKLGELRSSNPSGRVPDGVSAQPPDVLPAAAASAAAVAGAATDIMPRPSPTDSRGKTRERERDDDHDDHDDDLDRNAPTMIEPPSPSFSAAMLIAGRQREAGQSGSEVTSDHPANESIAGFVSATRGVSAAVDLTNPARPEWTPPVPGDLRRGARYLGIEEIARGGMGSIRVGFDRDLRREVAMKVILGGTSAPVDKQARFLEEAQVTGQLEHPNIVPVHDLGIGTDGSLFFTMKLVRGESLLEVIQKTRDHDAGHERHFTLPRMLQIFLRICDATAFAHSRGVIHRDLKPENVMVGGYGEVLVMDWGLSKVMGRPDQVRTRLDVTSDRSEEGLVKTHAGSIVGTPGHMPPEQARGELENLDERSDIYALGCILYEILTFEPPFPGNDVPKLIKLVRRGRFDPPTRRAPERNIPRELEEVVMRSMAFRKEDRYQTVRDLAAEIERYLDGRTLTSVSYTPGQLFGKWMRRNMKAAIVAVVFIVLSTLLGGYAVWSAVAERDAARNDAAALRDQVAQLAAAPRGLDDPGARLAMRRNSLLAEADAALAQHDAQLARLRLRQAAALPDTPSSQPFLRALERRLASMLDTSLRYLPTGDVITCIALDATRTRMLAGAANGRILLLDVREGARDQTAPVILHDHAVTAVCFVGDDILIGDETGQICRRATDGREIERQSAGTRAIINLIADSESLMVTDSIGRLTVWPLPFGPRPRSLRFASPYRFSAVAEGQTMIAYGTDVGIVQLAMQRAANRFISTTATSLGVIRHVEFGADDATLAVLGDAGVAVFDVLRDERDGDARLSMRYRLASPHDICGGLALDADNRLWIGSAGGFDSFALGTGCFCAQHSTALPVSGAPRTDDAPTVAPTRVSRLVTTVRGMAGLDTDGRLWVLDRRPALPTIVTPELSGSCRIAVSRNGQHCLVTDGAAVVVIDRALGWHPQRLVTPAPPGAVAFSPDGRRAFIACTNGQLLVHTGTEDGPLPVEPDSERRRPRGWDLIDTGAKGAASLLVHVGGRELFFVAAEARVTRVVLSDAVASLAAETVYSRVGPSDAGAVAAWSAAHRLLFRPREAGGGVDVLAAEDGALSGTIAVPPDAAGKPVRVTSLVLTPRADMLLVGDSRGRVHGIAGPAEAPAQWRTRWTLESVSARAIVKIVHAGDSGLMMTADAAGEVRAWRFDRDRAPEPRGTLVRAGLPHGPLALAVINDAERQAQVWFPVAGTGCPFGTARVIDLLGE
ncbi:MAG: protein kinase [Planctomycetota bacterium]